MTVRPGDVSPPRASAVSDHDRGADDSEGLEASWKALKEEVGQFAEDSRAVIALETRLFVRNSIGLLVVAILMVTFLATSWVMLLAALVVWLHVAFGVPLALVLALGGGVSLLAIVASIPLVKSLLRGLGFHQTRALFDNAIQAFTGRGESR